MSEDTEAAEANKRPEWLCCIQMSVDSKKAYCGRAFGFAEFHFLSIDHAYNSVKSGGRCVPCPECVKVVVNGLTNEP